jgi:hypothetical protein
MQVRRARHARWRWLLAWGFAADIANTVNGQCVRDWLDGDAFPGVLGSVNAMAKWDPDGAGPLPDGTVVAGRFTIAGDAVAANIAFWDGAHWSAMGSGTSGANPYYAAVHALAVMSDGSLVAGGEFTTAGSVLVNGSRAGRMEPGHRWALERTDR